MFETLKNVFRVKEMRRKLLYVIWMILVIRIGSQLPVPGVDSDFFKEWFAKNTGDAFNFFDAFTGGSFTQMSIFALNITPYITSSIIMQLLTIAIPALEEMQRDGEEGASLVCKCGQGRRCCSAGYERDKSIQESHQWVSAGIHTCRGWIYEYSGWH